MANTHRIAERLNYLHHRKSHTYTLAREGDCYVIGGGYSMGENEEITVSIRAVLLEVVAEWQKIELLQAAQEDRLVKTMSVATSDSRSQNFLTIISPNASVLTDANLHSIQAVLNAYNGMKESALAELKEDILDGRAFEEGYVLTPPNKEL